MGSNSRHSRQGAFSRSATETGRTLGILAAILAVIVAVALVAGSSYNGLVKKRNAVDQQFAQIDVQLQRRNDLIPNLVNAVKGALGQEQAVFGEIAQARTHYADAGSAEQKVGAANDLSGAISRLLVIVENYPQLQSNQNIRDLQIQLEGTENRISQERRQFNDVVTDYNNSIQTFPRNITAGIFGFSKKLLLVTPPDARANPQVDLGVAPTKTTAGGSTTTTLKP